MLTPSQILKEKSFVGKTVVMGIRPEDIDDGIEFIERNSKSVIEAQVEVAELMGAETNIYLSKGDTSIVARVNGSSKAKVGDKIKIAIDTSMYNQKYISFFPIGFVSYLPTISSFLRKIKK